MTCDCISTVNAMLAERNTKLMLPITFSSLNDPTEPQRLMVVTDQIETGRGKKKASGMFATCCPFCGQAYRRAGAQEIECHGLDTPDRVCFYEQDFYVLSNFSAFTVWWKGLRFDTSEAVYHWEKFNNAGLTPFEQAVLDSIRTAPSAHEAFKIGQKHKRLRRPNWDAVKVDVMRNILRAKVDQHEYVRRKLLATGDRELVENSWRDDFWGWGPNRDGLNMLGTLWMEIRAELGSQVEPEGDAA